MVKCDYKVLVPKREMMQWHLFSYHFLTTWYDLILIFFNLIEKWNDNAEG